MYQYTFDEDTTTKLTNSTNKTKSVFDQFGDVDNKFNTLSTSQQNLTLTPIKYEKPTAEDVKKQAQNSLNDFKAESLTSIHNDYLTKQAGLDESITKTKQNAVEDEAKIKDAYLSAKQNAKDDAIKRGLARSSIIVNTLASYDNGMLNDLQKKTAETNSKIEGYQTEKNLLEQQKQNALNAFDITYAVRLQEKIDSINKDIKEEEQEVVKYNNQIAEIQAKWEKSQADSNYDKATDLAELVGKYGSGIFEILKQNEKLEIARSHFAEISKTDAIDELKNNSAYYLNLGRKNYEILLQELENRQ